jgi:hypothetical protein
LAARFAVDRRKHRSNVGGTTRGWIRALQRFARYFGDRVTARTCLVCRNVDSENRSGERFAAPDAGMWIMSAAAAF